MYSHFKILALRIIFNMLVLCCCLAYTLDLLGTCRISEVLWAAKVNSCHVFTSIIVRTYSIPIHIFSFRCTKPKVLRTLNLFPLETETSLRAIYRVQKLPKEISKGMEGPCLPETKTGTTWRKFRQKRNNIIIIFSL